MDKRFGVLAVALWALAACTASQESVKEKKPAPAHVWRALPGATLSFILIKNGNMPVAGKFTDVTLALDVSGFPALRGDVRVGLDSLGTAVPLRDANIKQYFFETTAQTGWGEAIFSIELFDGPGFDPASMAEPVTGTVSGTLRIHGAEAPLRLSVMIAPAGQGRIHLTSLSPAHVSIASLGMVSNKARLMVQCGHKSVDDGVAITLDMQLARAAN